jgi:glutamate-1-semialdehyde 2,1-aminomutase
VTAAAQRTREAIEVAYRARTPRSEALYAESRERIPGGLTRSVAFYTPYPAFMAGGSGCHVRDADGNDYLDHLNNFGSIIHGHAHPAVTAAIREQVGQGTDFGSPTELHLALARELSRRVPSVERVRFTTSGTEAVLYAIRAARAFTGRVKVLKMEGSYHGGSDTVTVSVDPGAKAPDPPLGVAGSRGIPCDVLANTLVAPFNDLARASEIIRSHHRELAVVLVEPVTVRGLIAAERDFLEGLREVTRECGVLLLFDEVVTFRLAVGGAQSHFGVTPDLTTFGKIIGGGLPLGAFGGRADVMEGFDVTRPDHVHHSGTFSGNSAAIAGGLVSLDLLTGEAIARLNSMGDRLRDALRARLAAQGVAGQVTGLGSLIGLHLTGTPVRDYRSALRSNREAQRWLHLALMNSGVFARSTGSFFVSTPMGTREIDHTASVFGEALSGLLPLLKEG